MFFFGVFWGVFFVRLFDVFLNFTFFSVVLVVLDMLFVVFLIVLWCVFLDRGPWGVIFSVSLGLVP